MRLQHKRLPNGRPVVPHYTAPCGIGGLFWQSTGNEYDPEARLLSQLKIGNHHFHVEAFAVEDRDGIQVLVDEDFQEEFEGLHAVRGGDGGPFETMRVLGRDYVVVIAPHQKG